MELTSEDIKCLLSNSIQLFRAKDRDKFSYNYISAKTSLSPSFVERAAKNKLGEKLDASKIMALSGLVCERQESRHIANYFAKNLLDKDNSILKDAIYAKFVIESNRSISTELEQALQEEETYIPYALAANKKGTTFYITIQHFLLAMAEL